MKTRERIIETSLHLFNERGERSVTTNHIAAELGISPGNLYYHFRNKADIIYALFEHYEARVANYLAVDLERPLVMEDKARYLEDTFHVVWDFRFLYRDLAHLLEQDERLRGRYGEFVTHAMGQVLELLRHARDSGLMQLRDEDIEPLATNMWVVLTAWISFLQGTLTHNSSAPTITRAMVGRGIYQVICLEAPYLSSEARLYLPRLKEAWLDAEEPGQHRLFADQPPRSGSAGGKR